MRWPTILSLRVRSLFHRRRVEHELDEEMRFHLEQQIAANRAAGMSADGARYAALRSFGGVEQMKEECRDARALGWLEDLARDLRFAARTLRKSPGTSVAAVAALALGLGAVTAAFAIAHSVLWLPLPFPDSERLVSVSEYQADGGNLPTPPGDYLDIRARQRVFESVAAMQWPHRRTLQVGTAAKRAAVQSVTAEFLPTLRLQAMAGRLFTSTEAQAGSHLAVLTDRAWKRDFAADPSIVGKSVLLDGESYDVIGVVPYANCDLFGSPDLYTPLAIPANASRTERNLFVLARLAGGVTLSQADAELAAMDRQMAAQDPAAHAGFASRAESLRVYSTGFMRSRLTVFLAAVSFLWLIVCANVANLLLAKAAGRRAEFGVRRALGARASALVRQTIAETLLVTALASAAAFLLASWALSAFIRFAASPTFDMERLDQIAIHPAAIAFGLAIAVVSVTLCSLGPALVAVSSETGGVRLAGRSGGHGRGERRVREALVALEIALALVLLVGGGLFLSSLIRLQRADLGFEPRGVVTARASFVAANKGDRAAAIPYMEGLMARAAALPGAERVGATSRLPLNGGAAVYFHRPERPLPPAAHRDWSLFSVVTPDYLSIMRIPLLRGRQFTPQDDARAPRVAIVNQNFVREYFGGEDPIGKQLVLDTRDDILESGIAPGRIEIVGLLPAIHEVGIDEIPFPVMYLPFAQNPMPDMFLTVQSSREQSFAGALRTALGNGSGFDHVRTMEDLIADSLIHTRFNLVLIESFAALALLLAGLGIYAVLSHAVAQRTHEIGVRMALGAKPENVARLIVSRSAWLLAVGIAAGLALALYLGYLMRDMLYLVPHKHGGLLYRVSARDPLTLGAACAFVAAITLLASWIPARRAARVDPMVALRYE